MSAVTSKATSVEAIVQPPSEFCGTYTVHLPVGIRIHKTDCRITNLEPNSGLVGKAFVGDKIAAVNGVGVEKVDELEKLIKATKDSKVTLRVRHSMWSWSSHTCTTLERILTGGNDNDKVTGRAIDIYFVCIRMCRTPEIPTLPFELTVKYDARERLVIVGMPKDSIASIHLRAGDVIREVNDNPVASKTMLQFYITEGIEKYNMVRFLIECAAGGGDSYRDTVEMAPDVIEIANRQIDKYRRRLIPTQQKDILIRPADRAKAQKKNVVFTKQERAEIAIAADYDSTKLKPCKNRKG